MKLQPATLGDGIHMVEAGPFLVSIARHAAGKALASHAHANATAIILLRGDYFEECGKIRQSLAPLTGVIKPPHEPHANRIGKRGARSLIIETADAHSTRFEQPALLEKPELSVLILTAAKEISLAEPTAIVVESVIAEWLAGVGDVDERAMPEWLKRVRELIHTTSTEELRLARLASEVDLHPMYVARTFRRFVGRSIGEYAVALRLARAAKLLVEGSEHIGRVALQAGYYDHSHMTRDFRARTGMSPSDWRVISAA